MPYPLSCASLAKSGTLRPEDGTRQQLSSAALKWARLAPHQNRPAVDSLCAHAIPTPASTVQKFSSIPEDLL